MARVATMEHANVIVHYPGEDRFSLGLACFSGSNSNAQSMMAKSCITSSHVWGGSLKHLIYLCFDSLCYTLIRNLHDWFRKGHSNR